jgi:hypothetical protein
MVAKAVEALERILKAYGPGVLQTLAFDHYDKKTHKEVRKSRYQKAGRGPNDDVHNTGRALDIIIYAWEPPNFEKWSSEREIGYRLVDAFLRCQKDMAWNLMVYDQGEWDAEGIYKTRFAKATAKPMDRVAFEHLTHIHIQWPAKGEAKSNTEWEGILIAELHNI